MLFRVNHLTAGLALAGCTSFAQAAGFALIEQNASGLGNAYAGQAAAATDASTVFFNPAGMGLLPDSQLVVAGNLIKPSAEFQNGGSTAAPLQTLGGTGGDAGGLALVPNFYYVHPVNKELALGIGVNAPFGLKTEYDQTWMGRFQAVTSEVQTINVNPSLSYKLNDTVLLGIGLSAQYIDAKLTNMANYSAAIFNGGGGVSPISKAWPRSRVTTTAGATILGPCSTWAIPGSELPIVPRSITRWKVT